MSAITQAEKDSMLDATITLDGHPARIVGRLRDCATVMRTDTTDTFGWFDTEFAWATAQHVIANGGNFKS